MQRNECAQFLFLCSAKALKKTWKFDAFAHDARFSFLVQLARSGQWRNLCQRNMKGHTTCDPNFLQAAIAASIFYMFSTWAKEKKNSIMCVCSKR